MYLNRSEWYLILPITTTLLLYNCQEYYGIVKSVFIFEKFNICEKYSEHSFSSNLFEIQLKSPNNHY